MLESYLKDKPLEDLYDLVLIPALSLVEQDRHRNELDEAMETFLFQSIKEVVEEINDQNIDQRERRAEDAEETVSRNTAPSSPEGRAAHQTICVVCMPARDEADEIVGSMLAHLLERAGYRTRFLDIGTAAEMLAQVSEEKPVIVCLSALPPFAIAHARRLYQSLRAQSPDLKIVIGLWNCDAKQASSRIGGIADSTVCMTLAHAIQQIRFLTEVAREPPLKSSIQLA